MQFSLGKSILSMSATAVVSGLFLSLRSTPPRAELAVWVFDEVHAATYRSLSPAFSDWTHQSLEVDLIGNTAINTRLTSLFASGRSGTVLPDAAEIEIGGIGRYLRPPTQSVGFLPLNDFLLNSGFRTIASTDAPGHEGWNARLETDNQVYTYTGGKWIWNRTKARPDCWMDRISKARLAPWTKHGVIFGIPRDVHPVTLTYRDDLFRQAGIDLSAATTWTDFQEKCLAFQRYWSSRGSPHRHAVELPPSSSDELVMMLLQRHLNVVDQWGHIHLTDPRLAATVAFYAQLVGGSRAIGGISEGGTGAWINDLAEGNVCCFWTPDWRSDQIGVYGDPSVLQGRLRMMPLPRFDSSDAPTATWGGTMMGIPRRSAHPAEAWKVIEFLYLSDEGFKAQQKTHVLPAVPDRWDTPRMRQPDPLFGGQCIDLLYAQLAAQVPERYVTPQTTLAQLELSVVVSRAVEYISQHGPGGVEAVIQKWLHWVQNDVTRRVEHATFDEG